RRLKPVPPTLAKVLTNAPVATLYSRTALVLKSLTNTSPFGPKAIPVAPLTLIDLTNAPVVPLHSSTVRETALGMRTHRSPLWPTARPLTEPIKAPPLAKVLTNAPVVPLYSSTVGPIRLSTNRSPFGPNARVCGAASTPAPLAKVLTNAPVNPL